MSVCNIIRDLMPLYTDSAISSDSRRAVKEHLRACPQCRTYFRQMRTEHHRALPPPPPQPSHETAYPALLHRMRAQEEKEKNLRLILLSATLLLQLATLAIRMSQDD